MYHQHLHLNLVQSDGSIYVSLNSLFPRFANTTYSFVVKTITHFIFITPFCSFTCSVNFPQFSYYTLFEWIVYYFHSFVDSTLMINTFLFFRNIQPHICNYISTKQHTHTRIQQKLIHKYSKYRRIPSQRSHG